MKLGSQVLNEDYRLKLDLQDWRYREGRMEGGKRGREKGGLSEAGFTGF